MLIDLHVHTRPKSDDSRMTPDELFRRAREVGLDGVCLTEHDAFWDERDVAAASRRTGLLVLPGCEVTTEEGHLLVFALDRYIFGMHRATFVKEAVDRAGGAIVVSHPYRRRLPDPGDRDPQHYADRMERACREPVFAMADAVEALNGRGSARENGFSEELRRRLKMPGTGSSDAHTLDDLGLYATEFDGPIRSVRDLVQALREGSCAPATLPMSTPPGPGAPEEVRP